MNNRAAADKQPDNRPKNRFVNMLRGRHGLVLGCFALVVTSALAFTHALTKSRIADNLHIHYQNTLAQVLPKQGQRYKIGQSPLVLHDRAANYDRSIHFVTHNDDRAAVIITAIAKNGYAGQIEMLVGILKDGTIAGVRVTKHQETPGLGDAIELSRSEWIKTFDGKSLDNPIESQWTVRKNNGAFDQFTAATITPRAVVVEVKNTLRFFRQTHTQIFTND